MRLGKRERAALRLRREQAAILAGHDERRQGLLPDARYASAWRRFFPVLRAVGVPRLNWSLGLTRGKKANTCPQGWPREPYRD